MLVWGGAEACYATSTSEIRFGVRMIDVGLIVDGCDGVMKDWSYILAVRTNGTVGTYVRIYMCRGRMSRSS